MLGKRFESNVGETGAGAASPPSRHGSVSVTLLATPLSDPRFRFGFSLYIFTKTIHH